MTDRLKNGFLKNVHPASLKSNFNGLLFLAIIQTLLDYFEPLIYRFYICRAIS